MFNGATRFDQYIGGWDVSEVTTFVRFFQNASILTNQERMQCFSQNTSQPISIFPHSFIKSKQESMFQDARNFNRDISNWDVYVGANFVSVYFKCFN